MTFPLLTRITKSITKKRLIYLLTILGVVASAVWCVYVLNTPGLAPVVISPYDPPILQVPEPTLQLGQVPIDSQVKASFILQNVGGKPLVIDEVSPSCGCTVAKLGKPVVPPGDFTRLDVVLDTSIKLGAVAKTVTIYSNDPHHPQLDLVLKAQVLPGEQTAFHDGPVRVKDRWVLFKGKCAECHVNKGVGKTGQALFQADCAMCHGVNGVGGVAMPLIYGNYQHPAYVAHVRKVIREGSANTPTMPPFATQHGGPLTDSQIDSLVLFLEFQAGEAKAAQQSKAHQQNEAQESSAHAKKPSHSL
ncbi:MAG: DUF1573 domain-containing protein [Candidatus Melainabacteria bacterium]|nr:DUF1573 domain-containing protein [Candidatus Melainabacteria bacterium]